MSSDVNAEQSEYWNEQAGPKWVDMQDFLDGQLGPLGLAAMERLGSLEGALVADIGCGCGSTSLELAGRVGPGSVYGFDLSSPMLTRARERAAAGGVENAHFLQADAQTHRFETRVDAVFSRFGVMFFADPAAAFSNLRSAMKPDGKLAFVCWRELRENEWMMIPLMAALEHLPPPELPAPDAPGPFSFADDGRLRGILDAAGFKQVEIDRHDADLRIGDGRELRDIVGILMQIGPTNRLLQEASEEVREQVFASIEASLRPFEDGAGLTMRGSTWLVSARA